MENTCGNKVMTFSCKYKNNDVVIKEVNSSFSYGRDCLIVDEAKELFGLNKIGISRFRCNSIARKINKKLKTWINNYEIIDKPDTIYLLMNKYDGYILNNYNKWYQNSDIFDEYIKIGLFRGIFRVTDFNSRNVLINEKNLNMCSIDENNIGERIDILDKKNIKKFNKDNVTKKLVEILCDKDNKLNEIEKILLKYEKLEKLDIIKSNFAKLENDVKKELN